MSDWAFCKIYEIPDAEDPSIIYLKRWRLIQTPWFALFLHKINLDDGDRCLHDHPYNFTSLILRGGYEEIVDKTNADQLNDYPDVNNWGVGSLHWMKAERFHRITVLNRIPTWTLIFVGRRRRKWGFKTKEGWVPWEDYLRETGKSFA